MLFVDPSHLAVLVVFDDADQRKLPQGRQVERTLGQGTVTEEGGCDLVDISHHSDSAAPVVIGMPPATIPLARSIPASTSAMCTDLSLPLQ